jgi:hypothetical protein
MILGVDLGNVSTRDMKDLCSNPLRFVKLGSKGIITSCIPFDHEQKAY